jgi:type IV pilus assembly protein PilM
MAISLQTIREKLRRIPWPAALVEAPAPGAALHVSERALALSSVGWRSDGRPYLQSYFLAELAEGSVRPGLISSNLKDREGLGRTLGTLTSESSVEIRRIGLVLPDIVARVQLLEQESLPARRKEALGLIRWKLRRGLPFPPEEAHLDYLFLPSSNGAPASTLAAVMRRRVLDEYEAFARRLGTRPAAVTLESLALQALYAPLAAREIEAGQDWGLLTSGSWGFTLLLFRGQRLLFWRTKPRSGAAGVEAVFLRELGPSVEYYRTRLGGTGMSLLLLAAESGGVTQELLESVANTARTRVIAPEPADVMEIPPDLELAQADRVRLAPSLGLAVGGTLMRGVAGGAP